MFENVKPTSPAPSNLTNQIIAYINQSNDMACNGAITTGINLTQIDWFKFLSNLPDDCISFNESGAGALQFTGMFVLRYWGVDRIATIVDDLITSPGTVTDFVGGKTINQALLDAFVAHGVVALVTGSIIASPRIYNLINAVK